MNNPVGYLLKKNTGLEGGRGICFDYVVSGNGVWVEAEGPLFAARVLVSDGDIKGLAPNEQSLVLRHGLIPHGLFDLAFNIFLSDKTREWYTAITHTDAYHIVQPAQTRSGARVIYDNPTSVILDLHSHDSMPAFFSGPKECDGTDDHDEQGLRIYGVVGKIDTVPELALRVGVYGHFADLEWGDVFDGEPTGVVMKSVAEAEIESLASEPFAITTKAAPTSLREELGDREIIVLPPHPKQLEPPEKRRWWQFWPSTKPTIGQGHTDHPRFHVAPVQEKRDKCIESK